MPYREPKCRVSRETLCTLMHIAGKTLGAVDEKLRAKACEEGGDELNRHSRQKHRDTCEVRYSGGCELCTLYLRMDGLLP